MEINKTQGILQITEERRQQIERHGRTILSDVKSNDGEQLSQAASFLLSVPNNVINDPNDKAVDQVLLLYKPLGWDNSIWLKMCKKSYKERLVIAGALVAAEIDRISYE